MTITRRRFHELLGGSLATGALGGCAALPPRAGGAVDCHAHVFTRELPMPDRRRAPSGYDATPDDYLARLDAHGIARGVLVQPSFLGTDNSYLAAACRQHPDRLRGIAVVDPTIRGAELQRLDDAGVVGIRLNLIGLPTPDFGSTAWRALLAGLRERRWQVEVHQIAAQLQPVLEPLLTAEVNVVVDHFGRPSEALGVDDPGFRHLLTLAPTRRVWVKLSGAYRNGAGGRGASFGVERLVWGSDWPHTLFEKSVDYTGQRRLLDAWLPDAAERRVVLEETPARLFGFAMR